MAHTPVRVRRRAGLPTHRVLLAPTATVLVSFLVTLLGLGACMAGDSNRAAPRRRPQGVQVHEIAAVGGLPTAVDAPEGRWIISSPIHGTGSGPRVAEILLLDRRTGAIERTFPFPVEHSPQGLLLTDDALYCLRQGDGGAPDSLLCRIDRRTFKMIARVFPFASIEGPDETLASRLPKGWVVEEPIDYAVFESARLSGSRDGGDLVTSGQGPSLRFDPTTLELRGYDECDRPENPGDQVLQPDDDLQLAQITGWDPTARSLRFDPVGWGGPTTDSDAAIDDDVSEVRLAPVAPTVSVWLALTGDGDPDLDRTDDGIGQLAAPASNLAWLRMWHGTIISICEQYHP